MVKKLTIALFTVFVLSINVSAEDVGNIEIFDLNKESVIKVVKSDTEIEREVEDCIKNIKGIVTKFNPIPDNGYMIKIPLETPIMIDNQLLKSFVDEVIIILPKGENPYLMLFDNKDRALFFTFEKKLDSLLKRLKLSPYSHLVPKRGLIPLFGVNSLNPIISINFYVFIG